MRESFNSSFHYILEELDEMVEDSATTLQVKMQDNVVALAEQQRRVARMHRQLAAAMANGASPDPAVLTKLSGVRPSGGETSRIMPMDDATKLSGVRPSGGETSRVLPMNDATKLSGVRPNGGETSRVMPLESELFAKPPSVKTLVHEVEHGESWFVLVAQVAVAVALGSGYERFRTGRAKTH